MNTPQPRHRYLIFTPSSPQPTVVETTAERNAPQMPHPFLDLEPPAHHNAPPGTSEVAARKIGGKTAYLRELVLIYIAGQGNLGATDDEGEVALGMRCQTYTPRRNELVRLGLVVDSGRRRKTASGRNAAVWVLPMHATTAGGKP